MPRRRYRLVWEEQASISADYLQTNWGAFEGEPRKIQPDGWDVAGISEIQSLHDATRNTLTLIYSGHDGDAEKPKLRTVVVTLDRQPCRYGGGRFLFFCPICGRRSRKLAVLPQSVRCGLCGSITYRSKRKSGLQRLIWKADLIAGRLGCANWYGPVNERPKGMRRDTFERLMDEHATLVRQANRIIQPRLARAAARGQVAYLSAMMRAGM